MKTNLIRIPNPTDFGYMICDIDTEKIVGRHFYSPPYVPRDFDGDLVDYVGTGKEECLYWLCNGDTTTEVTANQFKTHFDLDYCQKETNVCITVSTKCCDHCGRNDDVCDVSWVTNPYDDDIHGEENWEWICDKCYTELCEDI